MIYGKIILNNRNTIEDLYLINEYIKDQGCKVCINANLLEKTCYCGKCLNQSKKHYEFAGIKEIKIS